MDDTGLISKIATDGIPLLQQLTSYYTKLYS